MHGQRHAAHTYENASLRMAADLHVGVKASASATSSSALLLAVFWGRPRERQALRGHVNGMT